MTEQQQDRAARRRVSRALRACLESGDHELAQMARARLEAILAGASGERERAGRLGISAQKWLQWRHNIALGYPVHQVGRPING